MVRSSRLYGNYTGIPALLFFELNNYGRGTQTHLEKMTILEKEYAYIRAYMAALKEDDFKQLNEDLAKNKTTLADAEEEITAMNKQYDPRFEGMASCSTEEKAFCHTMRGVFEMLTLITAISKIIDNQRPEEMSETFG
jgi:hypothetical protein